MPQTYSATRRPSSSGTAPSGGPSSTIGSNRSSPSAAVTPTSQLAHRPRPDGTGCISTPAGRRLRAMPAAPVPFALVGATVLDGSGGPPLPGHTVVVRDGRVHAVGPREELAPGEGIRAIPAAGLTVLPGFVDTHVHLDLHAPAAVLLGGVTTVRDLGWPAERLAVLEREAAAPVPVSPHLLRAGQILTAPGGYPTRAAWAPPGTARPVAGPAEAVRAVGELAEGRAAVVKVALDGRAGPTMPEATLAAVVAAARGRGLEVTAHVAGVREVEKALAAGVAELAHWPFTARPLPVTLCEALASSMTVVPT